LGIVISTQAPNDEHSLSQLIDDGLRSGDKSIVVKVISAPETADPFDPKTLRDCNPAIGKFLDEKDLLAEQQRAKRAPAFQPRFFNLRLNQRVDASEEARLLSPADWKRGAVGVLANKLKGRACFGGLDLSGKHDLCALELVFPDDQSDTGYDVLSFFWTPEGQLEARSQAERDRFKEWIRAGHLTSVPGPVVKFGFIARQIMELSRLYNIRAIGYDRWRIDEFKLDLEDLGGKVNLIEHGQGFKDMGPAVEFFAEKALAGLVRHGGHPVLTACVANAIVVSDPAGNQKFDKAKSNKGATIRIDGAVALAMAFGVARKFQEEPKPTYQMMII
jgi:phage terminase large subunit-like protein